MSSMRLAEVMSTLLNDQTIGERITKRMTKGLQKLFGQASATSLSDLEEGQVFFVAPKGAAVPQVMDLTQLNLHVVTILK